MTTSPIQHDVLPGRQPKAGNVRIIYSTNKNLIMPKLALLLISQAFPAMPCFPKSELFLLFPLFS
jgi:hypothetical protein